MTIDTDLRARAVTAGAGESEAAECDCPDDGPGALGALAPDSDLLALESGRRRVLKRLGVVTVGLAMARSLGNVAAAAEGPPPADVLVYIFLRGGLDSLNMVVPYGDPDYSAANRPTIGVYDSIALGDGFFGLHPAMSALVGPGKAWDPTTGMGDLAFVHAAGSPADTRSHFDAQDIIDRGVQAKGAANRDGWLARHLLSRAPTGPALRAIAVSSSTPVNLIGGGLNPVVMHTTADVSLRSVNATQVEPLLRRMHQGFAHPMVGASTTALDAVAKVRGLGSYSPAIGVTYPANGLAYGLKSLAQLIKAGANIGLEAASIDFGGFDMHKGMGTSAVGPLHDLLGQVADSLAAFRSDLQDIELATAQPYWKRVTVVAVSEFGRRFKENGNAGADHGHGGAMAVMGGGISGKAAGGGNVWLKDGWPGLSDAADRPPGSGLVTGDLQVRADYRHVLWEVARQRLGALDANRATVFPALPLAPFMGFAQPKT